MKFIKGRKKKDYLKKKFMQLGITSL